MRTYTVGHRGNSLWPDNDRLVFARFCRRSCWVPICSCCSVMSMACITAIPASGCQCPAYCPESREPHLTLRIEALAGWAGAPGRLVDTRGKWTSKLQFRPDRDCHRYGRNSAVSMSGQVPLVMILWAISKAAQKATRFLCHGQPMASRKPMVAWAAEAGW